MADQQVAVGGPSLSVGAPSVAAPQKGAQGGGGWGWRWRWRERISPTRCVSSMPICHPLLIFTVRLLDQSVTLAEHRCPSDSSLLRTGKTKKTRVEKLLKSLSAGRVVTLDRFPCGSVSSCLLCPRGHLSVNAPLRYLHLKGTITRGTHYYIYQTSSICCISPSKIPAPFPPRCIFDLCDCLQFIMTPSVCRGAAY